MQYSSIGDLSQNLQLRRYNAQMKADLARLSEEMATGKKADIGKAVRGDFRPLAGIESSLNALEAYNAITNEAALFSSAMQSRLEFVQEQAQSVTANLLSDAFLTDPNMANIVAENAREAMEAVVSSLNGRGPSGSLFAGTATDGSALAPAEDMLADLKLAVAGETTAAGVAAIVSDWFHAVGGGFETSGYLGSADAPSDYRLSADETAGIGVTAADPAIRTVLEGLALAALVAEDVPPGDNAAQKEMHQMSRDILLTGADQIVGLRAEVGNFEAAVAQSAARNEAEKGALEIARSDIVSADPYDTASQLEAVQTQLETLYAVTSRLSRLSLVDFLR